MLDLHGYRVRDALKEIERMIDEAIPANLRELHVLHGVGTGTLLRAIHDHLAHHDAVAEYSTSSGNPGLTIVRLA